MEAAIRALYDNSRDFGQKAFKSGCYAPFTSLNFTPMGNVLVCCKNDKYVLGNVATKRLPEIWQGRPLSNLRKTLNDYNFDSGCQECEWLIATGNYHGSNTANFEEFPVQSLDPEWPQIMGFALSNACNFECIMCSGELSSSIRAHREGLPALPKMYKEQFFQDLRPFLPHLRQTIFYGGEPFLTPECFRVWDMMIEEGVTNTRSHVTTNASQYNAKVERVLEALPFSLSISMDGATKETVEKVRVNCKFEEFSRNVLRFREYSRRHQSHFNLSYCLMRQNWHEFGDVLLFAEELGCTVFVNTVVGPEHCSLYTLPAEELNRIVDEMERQGIRLEGKLPINRQVWEDHLRYLKTNANGRKVEALTQIRGALAHNLPSDQSIGYHLSHARILAEADRLSEALEEVLKVDDSNLYYFEALVLCGQILRALGHLERAEGVLDRASLLSKRPIDALIARGWLRRELGRFSESLEDGLRACELCSVSDQYRAQRYESLLLCGRLLLEMGNLEQAEIDLNRALELSPQPREALFERSWLRLAQQRFEDGIDDALRANALCQNDAWLQACVQETLVCLYFYAGRIGEAKLILDRLREGKPVDARFRVTADGIFEMGGLPEKTRREVRLAIGLTPFQAAGGEDECHVPAGTSDSVLPRGEK